MNKGFLSHWRRAAGTKRIVYPMITFFLLTPFLLSCGGSGSTPAAEQAAPSPSRILTSAVESQNQSAQDAVSDVIEFAITMTELQEVIEAAFGTMTPTVEEIELWVAANPDEADGLLNWIDLLVQQAQQHAYQFEDAIADMIHQENIIISEMGLNSNTRATVVLEGLATVGAALVILTMFGAGFGAMKGALEEFDKCFLITGENISVEVAARLKCIFVDQGPQAIVGAIKGTISSGVTTVASWAAGIQQWRIVKFLIDGYGAYDSADSINQAYGVRRCEQTDRGLTKRTLLQAGQLQMIDFEDLTPDDVYIGTSEDGAFHNVPEGDWTFVFFEDGYLRHQTQCVVVAGEDPIEVRVTMIPIEALPIEPPPDDNGGDAPPPDDNGGDDDDVETMQYHVFKRSGLGYKKGYSGCATRMEGYDYFYQKAFPSEVNEIIAEKGNFERDNENACQGGPWAGPSPSFPAIWANGAVELVGSFDTFEEIDPYRCQTSQYDPRSVICTTWVHDLVCPPNPKADNYWDAIDSICGS